MPFIANSTADREAMLRAVGARKIEELFDDIPAAHRFPALDLPAPLSEMEVLREIEAMGYPKKNARRTKQYEIRLEDKIHNNGW